MKEIKRARKTKDEQEYQNELKIRIKNVTE